LRGSDRRRTVHQPNTKRVSFTLLVRVVQTRGGRGIIPPINGFCVRRSWAFDQAAVREKRADERRNRTNKIRK